MQEPRSRSARGAANAGRNTLRVGLLVLVAATTGCQGGTGVLRRWSLQRDPTFAKPITDDELGDNRNMVAKWLSPKATGNSRAFNATQALAPSKLDAETGAQIAAAEDLFQQGRLAEAEKAFASLERKKTKAAISIDYDGSEAKESKNLWSKAKDVTSFNKKRKIEPTWGDRILFYLAESQYQQGKFIAANDTYERLLNQYPGTPNKDKAIAREFAIAQFWLAAGLDRKSGDVADASGKDSEVRQASWTDHFNGRMPLIDVDGYALRAMEHVMHHDPEGPLADVAAITLADHYLEKADYENASATYDQLLTSHPKSKLVQRAQLGSIDAKMRGYLGPEYDSNGLEKAQVLIRQTLAAFPNRDQAVTDKLHKDLDLIADQLAERTYKTGEFYRRTRYTGGAEYYFGEVRARWPESPWAEKAKEELATLAKAPRKKVAPSKILTLPGASDPNATGNSMGSMATMPGGGMGGSIGAGP